MVQTSGLGFLLLAVALFACAPSNAQPTKLALPQASINLSNHSAMIRRMVLNQQHQVVVTAADDKTIRLWSQRTLKLLEVFRLPKLPGVEGRPYALDSTADWVAVGGWTGLELSDDGSGVVYLINLSNSGARRVLPRIPGAISFLKFSPDGERLAIGIFSQTFSGLLIVDVASGHIVGTDADYAGRIWGMDYHETYGLVTTSFDGMVRRYSNDLELLEKQILPYEQPADIRYSKDGKQLIVGYLDQPAYSSHNSIGLTQRYARVVADRGIKNLPGIAVNKNQCVTYGDSGGFAITFDCTTGQRQKDWSLGTNRLTAATPFANGFHFSSENPSIIQVDSSGNSVRSRTGGLSSYRSLSLHEDSAVSYGLMKTGSGTYQPLQNKFSSRAQPTKDGSVPRNTELPFSKNPLSISGNKIHLEKYDILRDVALDHRNGRLIVGSDMSIASYTKSGALQWRNLTNQVVRQVATHPESNAIAAALSDGTIRWYRAEDGYLFHSFFQDPDSLEWIGWAPSGVYQSSIAGDELLGWQINQQLNEAPIYFQAVQLERQLYQPQTVAKIMHSLGKQRLPRIDFSQILPPRLRVTNTTGSYRALTAESKYLQLTVDVVAGSQPLENLVLYKNGVPITPSAQRSLPKNPRYSATFNIAVDANDMQIRFEVFAGSSMGLLEKRFEAIAAKPTESKGDLYLLNIGVNRFDDGCEAGSAGDCWVNLRGTNDAVELNRTFGAAPKSLFRSVNSLVLSDESDLKPTKSNILQAMEFVRRSGPADTLIMSLASHGLSDSKGNYYFVPSDGRIADGFKVRDDSSDVPSLIGWQTFFEALRQAAGRRILIVDTCESADMIGSFDPFVLAKRSYGSRFALVSAAQGDQESFEWYDEASNKEMGLFTHALLESIRRAPSEGEPQTLRKLFENSLPLVQKLAPGPQTPGLVAPWPLGESVLHH